MNSASIHNRPTAAGLEWEFVLEADSANAIPKLKTQERSLGLSGVRPVIICTAG